MNLGTVTNPAFSLAADTNSFINLVTPSDLTFGNNIAGAGSVRKTGTGLLKLTGANSGHLIVQEGNVQIGGGSTAINWGSAGSSVTLQNGTSLIIAGNSAHHTIGSDLILGTAASDAVSLKWVDASQANATNYQHNFTGTVTVNGAATLVGRDNWAKEMGFTGTLTGAGSGTTQRQPSSAVTPRQHDHHERLQRQAHLHGAGQGSPSRPARIPPRFAFMRAGGY